MIWSCPAEIERALWTAAESVLGSEPLARKRLRDAVIERSRLYTSERQALNEPSDRPADVAARALFYSVADAAKVMIPMAELRQRGLLPEAVSVLDVGAGCGAMTLGLHAAGVGLRSVTAIDNDATALRIAARAARELGINFVPRTESLLSAALTGRYDLIVAGTVINEIREPAVLVKRLLGRLSPGGSLVIIEPALRDTARGLHRLRDHVLEQRLASVFAPCTRTESRCPALDDERDWCHEDRRSDLPERARELAGETGLRKHGLKFSYLVLRQDGAQLHGDSTVPVARVVSRVRKLKGRWQGFVCSERGRERVTLLKRNVSTATRAFTELERGDLVSGVIAPRIEGGQAIARVVPTDRPTRG